MLRRGRFREDLYYRLRGFELDIPPLREHIHDVPALTHHFVRHFSQEFGKRVTGVTPDVMQCLMAYRYPGNVRELAREVRRLVALANDGETSRHLSRDFSVHLRMPANGGSINAGATLKERVEALETYLVADALARHRWNRSRAARELGLSRVGLANRIRNYRIVRTSA